MGIELVIRSCPVGNRIGWIDGVTSHQLQLNCLAKLLGLVAFDIRLGFERWNGPWRGQSSAIVAKILQLSEENNNVCCIILTKFTMLHDNNDEVTARPIENRYQNLIKLQQFKDIERYSGLFIFKVIKNFPSDPMNILL